MEAVSMQSMEGLWEFAAKPTEVSLLHLLLLWLFDFKKRLETARGGKEIDEMISV